MLKIISSNKKRLTKCALSLNFFLTRTNPTYDGASMTNMSTNGAVRQQSYLAWQHINSRLYTLLNPWNDVLWQTFLPRQWLSESPYINVHRMKRACVYKEVIPGQYFSIFFSNFVSFQLKHISASPLIYWCIFMTTTNNQENSVRAILENIVLPNHRFAVWFSSDRLENCILVKYNAICDQNVFWYVLWMVLSTCSSSSSS